MEAGFTEIHIEAVGGSPLMANLNAIILSIPRPMRPVLYLWYAFWDAVFLGARSEARSRAPLGFLFRATIPSHA
jgi:hypothetical protein